MAIGGTVSRSIRPSADPPGRSWQTAEPLFGGSIPPVATTSPVSCCIGNSEARGSRAGSQFSPWSDGGCSGAVQSGTRRRRSVHGIGSRTTISHTRAAIGSLALVGSGASLLQHKHVGRWPALTFWVFLARRSGGTGRRSGLKLRGPQGRVGSNPSSGTTLLPSSGPPSRVQNERRAARATRLRYGRNGLLELGSDVAEHGVETDCPAKPDRRCGRPSGRFGPGSARSACRSCSG
jgi:hypothetical protein